MPPTSENSGNHLTRGPLRGYLLSLLPAAESRQAEAHLETCETCRANLEKEREALAQLDALGAPEPPDALAEHTIAHIHEQNARPAAWSWGAAAPVLAVVLVLAVGAFIVLPMFGRARESARRASIANNLKQWGLVMKMYANESRGEVYPPLTPYHGYWVPDLEALWPKFVTDPCILVDPEREDDCADIQQALRQNPPDFETATRIMAENFAYLGYAVKDPEKARFLVAQRNTGTLPENEAGDVQADSGTIYRLREGIERFFLTDINNPAASARKQSDIPVMVAMEERPGPDGPGYFVLFLDGHVEFVKVGEGILTDPQLVEQLKPKPPGEK